MIHRFQWQFPCDHPALAGHFPHRPVAPGAVLLDRLELFAASLADPSGGSLHIKSAKFLRTVDPGDVLDFSVQAAQSGQFEFRIERGGSLITQGLLVVTHTAA
jgi:3-hydroxymyristoyl/3-hydroxydecanoyl-(acyl carrier protein) dehydratase